MLSSIQYWKRYWEAIRSSNAESLERDVQVEGDGATPWDRWDFVALALAVFTAVWVFALKLKTFYDLGYSGDLFAVVQACSKLA